jgi:4-oxalocrotonate tautomerase
MPIIQVQMMEGRTDEKIKELMARLTDTISETIDVPKDRVRVIVTEVPKARWSIAGVPASEIPGR